MQVQTDSIGVYSALEKALAITGEYCKNVTLFQLRNEYGISPTSHTGFSMTDLENALTEMYGQGASLILKRLRLELQT